MKKIIILLIEFALIIGLIISIYVLNLSKKIDYTYTYHKPLLRTQLSLSDYALKEGLLFFLAKELGLYAEELQILDVVYLYTNDITGADYILVTFNTADGRLCQITVSRNFLPWAKWETDPKSFNIIESPKTILESEFPVPKWMQELGVTAEQLRRYYAIHPEVSRAPEESFYDKKTGKFSLPADWYQTLFVLVTEKDKAPRLIPDRGEKVKAEIVDSYWKADYPREYLGLGYREYLYRKIEEGKRR